MHTGAPALMGGWHVPAPHQVSDGQPIPPIHSVWDPGSSGKSMAVTRQLTLWSPLSSHSAPPWS